jgi:predicted Holliday junction resolvase-like endonuclease
MVTAIIMTIVAIVIIVIFIYALKKSEDKYTALAENYTKLLSSKKQSEIVTGLVAEKLVPFLKDFNHDPQNIQFLGQPIDYISFEKDKIVIIEVKSGNAKLTAKQRNVRDLIKEGKVEWEVYRIK